MSDEIFKDADIELRVAMRDSISKELYTESIDLTETTAVLLHKKQSLSGDLDTLVAEDGPWLARWTAGDMSWDAVTGTLTINVSASDTEDLPHGKVVGKVILLIRAKNDAGKQLGIETLLLDVKA